VRARLLTAGAAPGFAGMLVDVRWDRNGELLARDEVLRLRVFHPVKGEVHAVLGWKGATAVSADGFKERRELEYAISGTLAPPHALLEALGYLPLYTIERYVEYFQLGTTTFRLEWYPRMDTLIEIEGDVQGIENGIQVTGLLRNSFLPDPLSVFAARFAARTGKRAVMTIAELGSDPPSWESR
jgi:adenylate cyclase class IV